MGYGLNNVVTDEKGNCIDPRINTDFFQSEEYWGKIDDVDGFFTWIEENKEECKKVLREVEPTRRNDNDAFDFNINWALGSWKKKEIKYNHHSVTYDSEYGLPEILLFSDIERAEWARGDNTIDYYESNDSECHIKKLDHHCGIYPYVGIVHIPHAPNFGKENYFDFYDPSEYNQMVGRWSKRMKPLLVDNAQLEYFKKWYRPVISPMVLLYIKFLDIFKCYNETVQELRPMIYTYWA